MRPCIYTFLRFVLSLEIAQSGLILRYVTTLTACIQCRESTTLTLLPINCRSASSQNKCCKRRWCWQNQNMKPICSNPNNKTSMIYKYTSSITGCNAIPPTVYFDSCSASSDMDKASLFNEYFHSVFTTSTFELPPACDRPEPVSCLSDLTITTTEVYQGLSSLDPGKAMGCDGIGPKLLKHCALALYHFIICFP